MNLEVSIDRLRKVVEKYNEDPGYQLRMWYDSMINTIIFARIERSPLEVQVFHMQDSLQSFKAIECVALSYFRNGEDEDSSILNAIFEVAEIVRDDA